MFKNKEKNTQQPTNRPKYGLSNALRVIFDGKAPISYEVGHGDASYDYERTKKWCKRTLNQLTEYLRANNFKPCTIEAQHTLLNYLLVLYITAQEDVNTNLGNTEFKGEIKYYDKFIRYCLTSHIDINKKGNFIKKTISPKDMSYFFARFSECVEALHEKKCFPLTKEMVKKIKAFKNDNSKDFKENFLNFMCIFFERE